MARDTWFETVAVAQERAKKRLPKAVYSALLAGSEKGLTYSDNVEAFAELGFAPHVIGATPTRDLATTVMGQDISMPVLISPTGVQAVHPDGEVAVARAAAARGTAMGLSSFGSKPIEEVIAANPKTFFQIYWGGGRDVDAGVSAISVSNHGGNNLDGTPASIRALPAVAEAVGDQVEVLLDGGIRRGSDVVKALALGARAVMIGRAYLWGLAAEGQAGVENVLDILSSGIDSALRGLAKASVQDLSPDDVLVPPGFTRTLGVPGGAG